jgi:hypothetical protein
LTVFGPPVNVGSTSHPKVFGAWVSGLPSVLP